MAGWDPLVTGSKPGPPSKSAHAENDSEKAYTAMTSVSAESALSYSKETRVQCHLLSKLTVGGWEVNQTLHVVSVWSFLCDLTRAELLLYQHMKGECMTEK